MRKIIGLLVVGLLTMGLVVGMAWAGNMTPDEAIAVAKAKPAQIDKRLAAEKSAIDQRYKQQAKQLELARRAEAQAAVAPAADEVAGQGFRRSLTAAVKAVFTTPGAMVVGAYEGIKYVSKSKLKNPVSRFCRGVNVAVDQGVGNIMGCGTEFFTPWKTAEYANPSQLNLLALHTIKYGPITQIGRTAAWAVPMGMLATCSLSAIPTVSQAGSMAIYGASGYVAGFGFAEVMDRLERYITGAIF